MKFLGLPPLATEHGADVDRLILYVHLLMGALFAHARMTDELYATSYAFLGHRRGGLAMATILACGGFSAVSGSSLACAATMAKVSVPLMRQYNYAPGFAAGAVAVGGLACVVATLGVAWRVPEVRNLTGTGPAESASAPRSGEAASERTVPHATGAPGPHRGGVSS